ncbi:MAG TPA: cyclohexanone monooxygenase, partial [Rhodospirillaceae bacterium]|nr:cyclohexanone monooxygenase [Rhodospirillaceae bacterium]
MSDQSETAASVDTVIVGAGFAGLYMLRRSLEAGLSARCFERGDGVGGTWYWNRYPGARCDVESMEYSFSFDEALQQEWDWSEKYSAQPDILAYINHVAGRFDLKRHIDFETEVQSAHFDAGTRRWQVVTSAGETVTAKFVVMATGCLSSAQIPKFEGLADFAGKIYHTGMWPHETVGFEGECVAVVGTGSSGIQVIPEIAREAEHLTVFQRTANFSVPARNAPITDDYAASWKEGYSEKRAAMRYSLQGNLRVRNDKSALEVSDAERQATYEARWQAGGSGFLAAFND